MKRLVTVMVLSLSVRAFGGLSVVHSKGPADFVLFDGQTPASIFVETHDAPAVIRASGDLAEDLQRVTGLKPEMLSAPAGSSNLVLIGTLGRSKVIDDLAATGKLNVAGIRGEWESYTLQVVKNPMPGISQALVVAGSDRRGTIFGIYALSEMIGVSPWYWWADVPVRHRNFLALRGTPLKQGPPAVKYRGIFLNDEDWGLRPWAAKTFDPQTGNIGPKTYAKIFELLLRLHANCLWPAMHPGTRAFNFYPEDKALADHYGIVMGSSHCEQMLRDNIDEWKPAVNGQYNFVTNPDGVLKYWEQRVRENREYENIYTLGMRGISDSGMPGGGTLQEKAVRLHTIITDQRVMLARWVNPDVARVPQIFCPYKEVLELYRLMPDLPDDITLVWPDDNYGYVREYSNATERKRSGGAGVYYHVSYWGRPRDYLWLCSTAPGLMAEEMTKAFDYGANRVWMLNVGDLKPAELDTEFFLNLAWNPDAWTGTNTYDLLERQLARDFGPEQAPELTSILAEYYRLNFQRKPEHMPVDLTNSFSTTLNGDEAQQRMNAWQKLARRTAIAGRSMPPDEQDAFFELIAYPVEAAAAMNEKCLALDEFYTGTNQDKAARLEEAEQAQLKIQSLTDIYNNRIAGGKWRYMMSDNPRRQLTLKIPDEVSINRSGGRETAAINAHGSSSGSLPRAATHNFPGTEFVQRDHCLVMEAEHASDFIPGKGAHWQITTGIGYNGEAVTIFPRRVPVCETTNEILNASPCLQYRMWIQHPGSWRFMVRALPTFSVQAGEPQRYAIAVDDEPLQIVSLPYSMSETDRHWQENVLRNAALTSSVHLIQRSGVHTLKIWMVDPGIVLDAIACQTGPEQDLGYVWPAETRQPQPNP